jgi:tRNA(fMet)-specific endonuclease VapC
MKSISYLLDTSVLVPLIREETKLLQNIPENVALYMSIIALGELYYGAFRSINVAKGILETEKLKQTLGIVDVDNETAKTYGRLKQEQNKKGKLVPDNDLWIAATALRNGLTLVTRDQHFTWIDKLSLEQW